MMNPRLTRQFDMVARRLGGILAVLMACTPSGRVVRHEPLGADAIPSETRSDPVVLDQAAFIGAVADLARRAPVAARPLEQARDLVGHALGSQSRLAPVLVASTGSPDDLTSEYRGWCARRRTPGDCLGLLQSAASLDADGRRTLGLAFAMGSVWEETEVALRTAIDPVRIQGAIVCMMAVYLTLWLLPEPVSKGVAAVLTATLIAYVGIDTVWSLIKGWRQLARVADATTSYDELRAAGKAYGKVMGQNAARVFVMLATAAIAGTASMAARLPALPGFEQAQLIGAAEGGFNIAAAGQIESVAIVSDGAVTISLVAAMVASGPPASLPVWKKGEPARGWLLTDKGVWMELHSGRAGGPPALPLPGRNYFNFLHVESHAAQVMRSEGMQQATLYINRVPCAVGPGCANQLPNMLPPGARLRVVGPDGYDQTFVGAPDSPGYPP